MNSMLKCFVLAASLAAGSCAITGPGYGGGYGDGYGNGYGNGNGYPPSTGYPGPGYGGAPTRFRCESEDGRQKFCSVDTRDGVRLVRQLSSTPCRRGTNWETQRRGVWVSHGCRAEFEVGYGGGGDYGSDGFRRSNPQQGVVRCESDDGRTRQCAADTRGGVQLVRQLSSSACVEGRTWGYSRDAVWVSQGCRADFRTGVGGGSGLGGSYGGDTGGVQTLRCESANDRQRQCNATVRRGVTLVRQLSSAACIEGSTWGWDRNGIWVDRGCRAEFRVD